MGGGYISFEFAHVARRAGAEPKILEQSSRVLRPFDSDLVGWLVDKSRNIGIEVRTDTVVESIERDRGGFNVRASTDGQKESFAADFVAHGAGRVPAIDPHDLEAAGVAHDKGRLKLNEFLQSTSNPGGVRGGRRRAGGPATNAGVEPRRQSGRGEPAEGQSL